MGNPFYCNAISGRVQPIDSSPFLRAYSTDKQNIRTAIDTDVQVAACHVLQLAMPMSTHQHCREGNQDALILKDGSTIQKIAPDGSDRNIKVPAHHIFSSQLSCMEVNTQTHAGHANATHKFCPKRDPVAPTKLMHIVTSVTTCSCQASVVGAWPPRLGAACQCTVTMHLAPRPALGRTRVNDTISFLRCASSSRSSSSVASMRPLTVSSRLSRLSTCRDSPIKPPCTQSCRCIRMHGVAEDVQDSVRLGMCLHEVAVQQVLQLLDIRAGHQESGTQPREFSPCKVASPSTASYDLLSLQHAIQSMPSAACAVQARRSAPCTPLCQLPRPHHCLQIAARCGLCIRLRSVKRGPASRRLPIQGVATPSTHALPQHHEACSVMRTWMRVTTIDSAYLPRVFLPLARSMSQVWAAALRLAACCEVCSGVAAASLAALLLRFLQRLV